MQPRRKLYRAKAWPSVSRETPPREVEGAMPWWLVAVLFNKKSRGRHAISETQAERLGKQGIANIRKNPDSMQQLAGLIGELQASRLRASQTKQPGANQSGDSNERRIPNHPPRRAD